MKEISQYQIEMELAICYYSQNKLASFVELSNKEEKFLEDLALSVFIEQRIDKINRGEFLTEKEFFAKLTKGEKK